MRKALDPLEVLDWLTLAGMVGFYGWLVYQVSATVHPIAGSVMGVMGCYFLLHSIDERRQRRKLAADEAKRAAGQFDAPADSSNDVRTPAPTSAAEDAAWRPG
jgi:hypothetical protein